MEDGIGVIIPAVTDYEHLERTLLALARDRETFALHVCVVSRHGPAFDERVRVSFPWVQVVGVPPGTSIPRMRHEGLSRLSTPLVSIIEDHVVVPAGWGRRMSECATRTGGVVAGPLSNAARSSLVHEAAFLCEYSHCLPPLPAGESRWLPGNNTTYPAALLRRHAGVMAEDGWEDRLHRAIADAGGRLVMDPSLEASHDLECTVSRYVVDRFRYSRAYAGTRFRGAAFARRLAYAMGSFLLPPILLVRVMSRALARPRYRGVAVMSLPLLVLFVVAWAAGEVVGYVAGPGNALGKVR